MKNRPSIINRSIVAPALLILAILSAGPSWALTINLRADVTTKTLPGGVQVPMWGFARDSSFTNEDGQVTVPGPVIVVPPGDSVLRINLKNKLTEARTGIPGGVPTSVIIPGLTTTFTPVKFTGGEYAGRMRSQTKLTQPGNTSVVVYGYNNVTPGTYLYQSGTQPQVQVQMGLYGAVKKDSAVGEAYPADGSTAAVTYDNDVILLYSEIDPALHAAVAANNYGSGKGVTSTIEYEPKYFLVNGEPFSGDPDAPGSMPIPNHALKSYERVLLRFLNAGLETHVPTVLDRYMTLVAEDGKHLHFPRQSYDVSLNAGMTTDAILEPIPLGRQAIYDRSATGLTNNGAPNGGLYAYLNVNSTGDFRTQLVKLTIPGGQAAVAASAPTDFQPVDPTRTITLIAGQTQHAMGWTQYVAQAPNQISAGVWLSNGSTLNAQRQTAYAQPDTVWVLLIEYVGLPGEPNEIVVRNQAAVVWTSGQATYLGPPIAAIANVGKVVVFNNGVVNSNTAINAFHRGDIRAYVTGAKSLAMRRGSATGAITSYHSVVEFVGANWKIQTGDATPGNQDLLGGPEAGGTDVTVGTVGDTQNAWVYHNWHCVNDTFGNRGIRAWLTSPTNLRVQQYPGVANPSFVRWYVISNPTMNVQTGAADDQFGPDLTATITGFTPVADLSRSFAWLTGPVHDAYMAHPRDMWQCELSDPGTISLQRGLEFGTLNYRYFVVELP